MPNMKVKEVYAKLLRPTVQRPTAQKTIEKLLGIDDINWQEVCMIPRKVSISYSIRLLTGCQVLLWNKPIKSH